MADIKPAEEPRINLPTAVLLATVIGTAALAVLGGYVVAGLRGDGGSIVMTTVYAACLVGGVSVLGVVVMGPWKTRRMGDWMNMWMAGTVVRLLVTPAAAFLLYSATSLDGRAFVLAVAATYVLTLFTESAVLALYVKRQSEGFTRSGGE